VLINAGYDQKIHFNPGIYALNTPASAGPQKVPAPNYLTQVITDKNKFLNLLESI